MAPPRLYDREKLVPEICERLAQGEPLAVILRSIGIPKETVRDWRQDDPEISKQFDEARDDGHDAIAWRTRETARGRGESSGDIQRDKLIIDNDHKLLSKWDPRRYGDKQTLEHTGPNGGPIQQFATQVDDPVQAAEIYKKVMAGEG